MYRIKKKIDKKKRENSERKTGWIRRQRCSFSAFCFLGTLSLSGFSWMSFFSVVVLLVFFFPVLFYSTAAGRFFFFKVFSLLLYKGKREAALQELLLTNSSFFVCVFCVEFLNKGWLRPTVEWDEKLICFFCVSYSGVWRKKRDGEGQNNVCEGRD